MLLFSLCDLYFSCTFSWTNVSSLSTYAVLANQSNISDQRQRDEGIDKHPVHEVNNNTQIM